MLKPKRFLAAAMAAMMMIPSISLSSDRAYRTKRTAGQGRHKRLIRGCLDGLGACATTLKNDWPNYIRKIAEKLKWMFFGKRLIIRADEKDHPL